jgi:hypothetical protein
LDFFVRLAFREKASLPNPPDGETWSIVCAQQLACFSPQAIGFCQFLQETDKN